MKDPCLDLLKVDEELLILKQKLTQKTEELKKDPKKKPVCRTGPDSSRNNLTPSGKKQESKRNTDKGEVEVIEVVEADEVLNRLLTRETLPGHRRTGA